MNSHECYKKSTGCPSFQIECQGGFRFFSIKIHAVFLFLTNTSKNIKRLLWFPLPVRFEMVFGKVQRIVTMTLLITLLVKAKGKERKVRAISKLDYLSLMLVTDFSTNECIEEFIKRK